MMLLRFRLYSDAPATIRELYMNTYDDILSKDSQRYDRYIQMWITILKDEDIGNEIDRKYLNRREGGIGGNDNQKDRQIRFFNHNEHLISCRKFGEITLRAEQSDDGICKWNVNELIEFGNKFKEMLEIMIGSECIDFYIALDV